MPSEIVDDLYPEEPKPEEGKASPKEVDPDAEIETEAMDTLRSKLGADVAEAVGAYVKACVRMGSK